MKPSSSTPASASPESSKPTTATSSKPGSAASPDPSPTPTDPDYPPVDRHFLIRNFIKIYWRSMFTFIWPILLLPLLIGSHIEETHRKKYRCLFVVLIMLGYWITECIPIFMTSLLPLFMMPALHLLTSLETTVCYFTSTTMNFLGCNFIGLAIKSSGLHYRIAMFFLTKMGLHPRRIHIVFCISAMIISLFLSNYITTALICPVIHGILKIFEQTGVCEAYKEMTEDEKKDPDKYPNPRNISKAYHIGISYSACIGGVISIIGSDTIKSYHRNLEIIYDQEDILKFHDWLLFALPIGLIIGIFNIIWLQFLYLGRFRPKSKDGQFWEALKPKRQELYEKITHNYEKMSHLTWHQGCICAVITFAFIFWVFAKPYFIPGFWDLYPHQYKNFIDLSAPTMFAVFLLFVIPSNIQFFKGQDVNEADLEPNQSVKPLITWKYLQTKTKWGLSFVIGSSFCLAIAAEENGVFTWAYEIIMGLIFKGLNKHAVVLFIQFLACICTEIVNNMALSEIFMMMALANLSKNLNVHPIYLGNAIVMGSSYCFMLPTGSVSNSMMMAYGYIRTHDFLVAGAPVKIFAFAVTSLFLPTYGNLFWNVDKLPDWAKHPANLTGFTTPL